jgi:hypothetical protein
MSSSINTACKSPSVHGALLRTVFIFVAMVCVAQDAPFRVPSDAVVGQGVSIATTGNGAATFYLSGPSISLKRGVQLGQNIELTRNFNPPAAMWLSCVPVLTAAPVFVARETGLAIPRSPSWAPVAVNDVISGVAPFVGPTPITGVRYNSVQLFKGCSTSRCTDS